METKMAATWINKNTAARPAAKSVTKRLHFLNFGYRYVRAVIARGAEMSQTHQKKADFTVIFHNNWL